MPSKAAHPPRALLDSATVEVTAHWEGGYRCRVPVRQFELHADEPESVAGGTDTGPQPTELLLAALASCFAMAMVYVAARKRLEITDLAVTAIGEHKGPSFGALRVEVRSSQPKEQLEPLLKHAATVCYVSNTLRNAPAVEYVVVTG
jgi:uncharacterized OsmC-like protein